LKSFNIYLLKKNFETGNEIITIVEDLFTIERDDGKKL
jgi:hypothetical protein